MSILKKIIRKSQNHPAKTAGLLKSRFSARQLLLFALVFAAVGGVVIYRSFAANANLVGDCNNDNVVNVTDLSTLLSNYGSSSSLSCDFNADNKISVLDLSALLSHYGQAYTPPNNCSQTLVAGSATTVSSFVSGLSAGQIGCLSGSFTEDLKISNGSVTLTSASGQTATLKGRLWIADSANDVTISNLKLDGTNASNLPSPTISGDRAHFTGNEVIGPNICFSIGLTPEEGPYGRAYDTLIEKNHIHNCGHVDNHDHGIYVESADRTIVRDNYIYDNFARGVQLYPDANFSLIEYNLIDGNGEGGNFGGGDGLGGFGQYASHDNVFQHNIISNATIRFLVESFWPNTVGTGNLVSQNCLWPTAPNSYYNTNMGLDLADGGFSVSANIQADPKFVNRAAKDFHLQAGSPCANYGPRS